MEAADPYYVPKPLLRRDTANLVLTLSLTCSVLATSSAHGFKWVDVVYLVVLSVLAARYALSRSGVLPMRVFEVSQWYTVAFIGVLAVGFVVAQRIPALQKPV